MKEKKNIGKVIWKHKIILLLGLIVLVGGAVFLKLKSRPSIKNEDIRSGIQTTVLKKRDLSSSVSVTGTIESSDKREVTTNLNDTEIEEIAVEVGDYVNAGDTIIVFDNQDLEEELETKQDDYELNSLKQNQSLQQAKDSVSEAESAYTKGVKEQESLVDDALSEYQKAQTKEADALSTYEKAKSTTKKVQDDYENLKKNKSSLKKAMNHAQKESREASQKLSEAKKAYETAEANIKYADQSDENYQALNQSYMEAYNTYQSAQSEAEQKEAAYNQAKSDYDAIETAKNAYEAAKLEEETAKNAYEEASNDADKKSQTYQKAVETQSDTNEKNAENIGDSKENLTVVAKEVNTNLKSQKKQVQEAEEKLGKCVVTSPISGYITSINAEIGDVYNGTDILFVVQDMTQLVVDATVDEYDISSLKKNQEAVIKTDATEEEKLKGTLTYVALVPDEDNNNSMGSSSSSSNYSIQITLAEQNEKLRIGMTAKTSIILESAKDVYAVAYDCIETDEEGNSYITVLDEEKQTTSGKNTDATKKIYVTAGVESDYYVEIEGDGLREGLKVVTPETVGNISDTNTDDFMMGEFPGGNMPDGSMPNDRSNGNGNGRGGNSGGGMPGGF